MAHRWSSRKSHKRRVRSGKITSVCGTIVCYSTDETSKRDSYHHPCPLCGTEVVSVRMPRGGWVHFEAMKELRRTKHWCLHLGEGMSPRRDDRTLELFNEEK